MKDRYLEFNDDAKKISGFEITIHDINPLFCAKEMLVMICSLMPIEELKKLNISEFLLNKFSILNGTKKFQLLVGATLKEDESILFKGPMIMEGNRKLYSLSSFPLKILLVIGENITLNGYGDFTEFLNSDVMKPITCNFKIGFAKEDLIDFISKTIQMIYF